MIRISSSIVVFALALSVAPAVAAPSPYKLGRYSGKIAVDQASGNAGTLAFTVHNRTITRLTAREQGMICIAASQGGGVFDTADYTLRVPKSWKIKIGHHGHFSFSGTLPGKRQPTLEFVGTVRGHIASGKITFGFNQSPGVTCNMSGLIRFRAKHRAR